MDGEVTRYQHSRSYTPVGVNKVKFSEKRKRPVHSAHIVEALLCARDSLLLVSRQTRPLLSGNLNFSEFQWVYSRNAGGG